MTEPDVKTTVRDFMGRMLAEAGVPDVDHLVDEVMERAERYGIDQPDRVEKVETSAGDVEATERLMHYWAEGEGAAKIRWGEPDDFYRCEAHLGKYVEPGEVKGLCANLHHRALGVWPGQEDAHKLFNPGQLRDEHGRWTHGGSGGATHAAFKPITAAEKRGNSRPVSAAEFQSIAAEGQRRLDALRKNSSPPAGLDQHWDKIKADSFAEAQKPWGGATIDAHTGKPIASDAKAFALTVKPPTLDSVSVPEHATREEFDKAMDEARQRFDGQLQSEGAHLGVFHDDDQHRIDIDPVLVVHSQDDVETIGAATHAVGGAYCFADGNGYWPPHVADTASKSAEQPVHFEGPGQWRTQAEQAQREAEQ